MAEASPAGIPTTRKPRWYAPTPAKFLFAVLVMQAVLFLSAHYRWFWFNERNGYTVLIAVGATAIALLLLIAAAGGSRFFKARMQFGLSTLFLMAPVMAVPCAWLAREIAQARQQWDVRALTDSDSTFPNDVPENWFTETLGADFFCDVTYLELSGDFITDEDVLKLKGLTQLQTLRLDRTQVTDAGLAHLKDLRQLESLSLRGTQVTDVGLAHLAGLTKMQELRLDGTQVTGVGLEHLKGLPHLQWLSLTGAQVTDGGLEHLKSLRMLKALYLDYTEVTDTGLEHLKGLTQLHTLDMSYTQITDAGLMSLRESLPNCGVRFTLRRSVY